VSCAGETLSSEDREQLAEVILSSLSVRRLDQLFVWSQTKLSAVLPHEILIFGIARGANSRIQFQRFSSTRYFRDNHFAEVCRSGEGLMERMVSLCQRTGEPCMISRTPAPGVLYDPRWIDAVEVNELRNVAAHGVRGGDGKFSSFFSFSRVGTEFGSRLSLLLSLLTPHLHTVLSGLFADEAQPAIRVVRTDCRVTNREAEILRWIRHGKTNDDIASILDLSPNTVKNHVKKILRKMGVENRSHAVARAFSLGILSPSDTWPQGNGGPTEQRNIV